MPDEETKPLNSSDTTEPCSPITPVEDSSEKNEHVPEEDEHYFVLSVTPGAPPSLKTVDSTQRLREILRGLISEGAAGYLYVIRGGELGELSVSQGFQTLRVRFPRSRKKLQVKQDVGFIACNDGWLGEE
jgi:hypothetical protein